MTDLATRLAYPFTTTAVVTATTVQASSLAIARAVAQPAAGTVMVLGGRSAVNDGGQGTFLWDATSTASDDGALTLAVSGVATGRWKRVYTGPIDVRWFGAVGNGTTDDTTAIQNAITACAAAGGGDVLFPLATYRINGPLTMASKVRLVLNGSTLVVTIRASQSCVGVRIASVSDVEVRGGTIRGELTGTVPTEGYGVYIDSATDVRLTDLELSYHWYDGVFISYSSDRVVQTRVNAHHNRRAGCSIIGGTNLVLKDGFYGDTGYASKPEGGEFGVNIECDGVGGAVDGVLIDNCDLARNGTPGNNTGTGFTCRKGVGGSRPANVRIARSRVKSNKIGGVVIDATDGISIERCVLTGHNGAVVAGANMYAIATENCTDVHIDGNRGSDNSRFALVLGCDRVTVTGNIASGTALPYSWTSPTANIGGDDYNGIEVRNNSNSVANASNKSVRVVGNTMIAFGGIGISVTHSASAEIANNISRDNGQHGISVLASPNALVTKNTSTGNSRQTNNTYSDIRIATGSDYASVFDNVCRYHEKYTTGTVQTTYSKDYLVLDPSTTSGQWINDWFYGVPVELTGGTGSGQRRTVNVYTSSTKRADIDSLVTQPDGTTTYAVRWSNLAAYSIRVDAGSTGVRVFGNDVRNASAISDAGTSTVAIQTLGNAATDLATVIALANNLRTALINHGIGTT